MPAGIDLLDMLTRGGQVAGQAQAVMPGTLDRPPQPGFSCHPPRPGQDLRIPLRAGGELLPGQCLAAAVTDRSGMSIAVRIHPDDQARDLTDTHHMSSFISDAGKAAPAWRETPAAIL
jgi:hypothetical protein